MAGGWESLGLLEELVQAVEDDFQWNLPTAIQDECIPLILGGGDVMAAAETGSGKTAAFALPTYQLCHEIITCSCSEEKRRLASAKKKSSCEHQTQKQRNEHRRHLRYEMSTIDRDKLIAIEPNSHGLSVQSRDEKRWAGCRSDAGIRKSLHPNAAKRYYFECEVKDEGIVRVGLSTEDGNLDLGVDACGYGFGGTGRKAHNSKFSEYGDSDGFGKGDVIGCLIDFTTADDNIDASRNKQGGSISFTKNGKLLGKAFDIANAPSEKKHKKRPATENDREDEIRIALYPTVALKNAECYFNFGGSKSEHQDKDDGPKYYNFRYAPPTGYVPIAWATQENGDGVENPNSSSHRPIPVIDNHDITSSEDTGTQSKYHGPIAIVIEPTRDLAEQTFSFFQQLSKLTTIRSVTLPSSKRNVINPALLIGGVSPKPTISALDANEVDILVGTPIIIASFIKKKKIHTSRCRLLILDEADQLLLDKENLPRLNFIYSRLPKGGGGGGGGVATAMPERDRLQVCFFSATLHSREVKDLASKICYNPLLVDLVGAKGSQFVPQTIHHCVVRIMPTTTTNTENNSSEDVEDLYDYYSNLPNVTTDAVHREGNLDKEIKDCSSVSNSEEDRMSEKIKRLKPKVFIKLLEKLKSQKVLVFCRTNLDCDLLEKYINKVAASSSHSASRYLYSCRVLAGKRSMAERTRNLKAFHDGKIRILIGTDVAARGIDMQNLPVVINFTFPNQPDNYIHRVGRVGRQGRLGLAISMVAADELKEKVWFCQQGNTPPCKDCRLYENGGNCIWYDEPSFLKQVQHKLKGIKFSQIQFLPRLEMPNEINVILEIRGYGNAKVVDSVYQEDPEVTSHLQLLSKGVRELAALEMKLSTDFHMMKNRFSGKQARKSQ